MLVGGFNCQNGCGSIWQCWNASLYSTHCSICCTDYDNSGVLSGIPYQRCVPLLASMLPLDWSLQLLVGSKRFQSLTWRMQIGKGTVRLHSIPQLSRNMSKEFALCCAMLCSICSFLADPRASQNLTLPLIALAALNATLLHSLIKSLPARSKG